ncbi:MAG: acyl-CoA thioesterase, partial [Chloroflexota bacterium]
LRLIIAFLRGYFGKKLDMSDTLVRTLRVWPGDLDINRHLNNGRYTTIIDLFIIESFLRLDILFPAFKRGWRPMFGGTIITFRKPLAPFEKYEVHFRLNGWDKHWNYMQYEFRKMDGTLAATGYSKGAFVSKQGLVPNSKVDKTLGIEREATELPLAVQQWKMAEHSMMDVLER